LSIQCNTAEPDGSILADEIKAWFGVRIKKQPIKEAMEQHVNIMVTCHMMAY
jgi:hypothetical protein